MIKNRGTVLDNLSDHIESLRKQIRRLPKNASVKDIGILFSSVLREIYPNAVVELSYRTGVSPDWQNIVESESGWLKQFISLPGSKKPTPCEIHKTEHGIAIIQTLTDASSVGLAVSGKDSGVELSDIDLLTMKLFIHLFDSAYQDMVYRRNEKGLVFSLNHRILQLNSLIDTGIEIASLDSVSSPYRLALERAASLTNASKGIVRVTRGGVLEGEYTFPDGISIGKSLNEKSAIITKFTFLNDEYSFQLVEKESRTGIVPFDETDQLLLDALARQVQASLENRFLHQQALEKQRIEQEMKVAATIQQKIIPKSLPAIPGYGLAGKNIPSKSVGGDYYDCILLPDGRYALVIADVTGKGVPAALLVSSLHAYLTAYFETSNSISELAGKLNKALYNATTDDKFVTAIIIVLSPETGEIEYSNAGHNEAFILRNDNSVYELKIGGFPLGALDLGLQYKSEKLTIGKGESLLLYTDGVTEASNEAEEFYEHKVDLRDFLVQNKTPNAETFITKLIADVKKFTGSAPQNDDITALYLYRIP
ncbi:MAG: PP2C family protein-serine/threonine phosphatase [Bacteroidota bacterium]